MKDAVTVCTIAFPMEVKIHVLLLIELIQAYGECKSGLEKIVLQLHV